MVRIDFNRLRFLVIDDNAHMRRILRTLLHGFGAREVYEAEDGAAGLEAFTHYIPDIVITDWAMPIFDGLELMQMIRQPGANANPYVAIIMLTGHSEKKRVMAARDAGVTEFLAKPISAKGALSAHRQRGRQPAPVHQDQDLFRAGSPPQHATANYVGPERRKGGKADIIRQTPLARKSTRPGLTKAARPCPVQKTRPRSSTYGDHEVIMPENKLRKAVSDAPFVPTARTIPSRAPKRRLPRSPANSARWMDSRMRPARQGPPRHPAQRIHRCQQGGAVPRRP